MIKQKGILIIEMLIGLLMSTITVLVIFAIYLSFEGEKRTIVASGDGYMNAAISMKNLEMKARSSGFGIPFKVSLNCIVRAYNKDGNEGMGSDFTFSLNPILIEHGVNNFESDKISFFEIDGSFKTNHLNLLQESNANNANLKVDQKWSVNPGNLILITQEGKDCNLAQVSGINGASNVLLRNTGQYMLNGVNYPIKYNKPGGLDGGVNYDIGAKIYNLGNQPKYITYYVENNFLREKNSIENTDFIFSNNVVLMKARYGLDLDSNGSIETWKNTQLSNEEYAKLKSLSLFILIRSPIKEKMVNNQCVATSPSGAIFNISQNENIDITNIIADWNCYRYKGIKSEVPLRNLVWQYESN